MEIDRTDENDVPEVGQDSPTAEPDMAAERDSPTEAGYEDSADLEAVQATYNAGYRADVAAEYQAAWDDAVPAFRKAWEEHEKTYPHPERTRPTLGDDGSWQGDGVLKLSPEQNDKADRGYERICEIGENVILPTMLRLEAEDADRHLAGLKNHLKDPDRIKEKIAEDILYKGRTPEQALENVKDGVRFTYVYSEERYSEGVQADCARLEASGFGRFDRQNHWEYDQYKGINSRWREPESGLLFEVQFHTQASSDAKELTHRAYERLRGETAQDVERKELEAFQNAVSSRIPIPPGATGIEDYSPEKRDG